MLFSHPWKPIETIVLFLGIYAGVSQEHLNLKLIGFPLNLAALLVGPSDEESPLLTHATGWRTFLGGPEVRAPPTPCSRHGVHAWLGN